MPEPTGIMGITSLTGATDALTMLSNAARRTGVLNQTGQNANGRPVNANGQDFSTVIDTTAMSVMASAALAPQATAGMIVPPMVTETRSYNTVEITTRSTAPRGNDYTQPTAVGETRRTAEAGEAIGADGSFDGRLDAALSDAGAQMQQETAESMGVSEEQVAFAMQQAGLNPLDLLSEEGLTELVMEVTGEDQTALLTDEELYSKIQMLFEEAETLKTSIAEEFETTIEGIEDAIAITTETNRQMSQAAASTGSATGEEGVFAFAERAGDETVLLQNTRVQGRTEGAEKEKEIPEEETDFTVRSERTVETERAQEQNNAQSGAGENSGSQTAAKQTAQVTEDHTTAQQSVVNTAEGFMNAVNDAVNAQTVYGAGTPVPTEAENVLRQVLDQMRTSVREGMTEVDMQLHPQSLGRVNVNLQAMDGGEVVARFTAQTEAARDALASQMPQLLQRFEEQGIKVNEVQVALAQEGFNQARDNEMRREDQQNEQQAGIERAGRMRRVQMDLANMTAEDIANLDEGERVEAEMMAAEGTTVNYRA